MKPLRSQNFYEVLGISRYASPEEIRNAYELSKLTFTQNSLATYSLFSEEENEEILDLIAKASETLLNPELKREYDVFLDSDAQGTHQAWQARRPPSTGERGAKTDPGAAKERARAAAVVPEPPAPRAGVTPAPVRPAPAQPAARAPLVERVPPAPRPLRDTSPPEPRTAQPSVAHLSPAQPAPAQPVPAPAPATPPAPTVSPAAANVERYLKTLEAFTGESLRRVREMRGISLFDLCSLTKIRQTYVDYIETENFKGLPAAVYVRGFVRLMADALQLPADRVTTDFMARYKQASTPTPARKT